MKFGADTYITNSFGGTGDYAILIGIELPKLTEVSSTMIGGHWFSMRAARW